MNLRIIAASLLGGSLFFVVLSFILPAMFGASASSEDIQDYQDSLQAMHASHIASHADGSHDGDESHNDELQAARQRFEAAAEKQKASENGGSGIAWTFRVLAILCGAGGIGAYVANKARGE